MDGFPEFDASFLLNSFDYESLRHLHLEIHVWQVLCYRGQHDPLAHACGVIIILLYMYTLSVCDGRLYATDVHEQSNAVSLGFLTLYTPIFLVGVTRA